MRILNFASANIDYVYDVNHIVKPGETISAKRMDIFAGGKGLNQSVATAKAGGSVYMQVLSAVTAISSSKFFRTAV